MTSPAVSLNLPDVQPLPSPAPGAPPSVYADALGAWYARRIDAAHRKAHGHYATPLAIARFMGALAVEGAARGEVVRLLDPAAGAGVLAACACEALVQAAPAVRRIELVLHEVDAGLAPVLGACLAQLERWLHERGIELDARLRLEDFVLAHAGALEGGLFPGETDFDAVICNPPYFKIGRSDPRAQACLVVIHGQPNLYGLFMALGAVLLRPGGRFVYITPRSWASGPYFQRFREWFFDRVGLTQLHVFDSRTEAFDEVLQETVVTAGRRSRDGRDGAVKDDGADEVELSASSGAIDIGSRRTRRLPRSGIVVGPCGRRTLHLPADRRDDDVRAVVEGWTGSPAQYGLQVSTGPVVAFRARRFLREQAGPGTAPLLWLQHVRPMAVQWPAATRKPEHIETTEDGSASLLLPNRNYVLLRRFTAKEEPRRLVAAPWLADGCAGRLIGFENHLNYIHRPEGGLDPCEAVGLAAVLNSALLDAYLRISSGNTQVSATELRTLPLPALPLIRRIGDRVKEAPDRLQAILAELLGDGS